MEDRFPIIDILEQTPPIPENCQWALFLRNHDELTLEMVTDEERDYMYRVYAHDPQARINLGIRRRLAPLLGNDRRRIELMNGLLFSLPGTPVIYYGDEIGMGDNIYLGDRNGVRTPMQWSADRNAGFSPANPQQLYLPVIIDPEYHYEAVNVEAQQANPHSLLWWMKRLIALRKRHRAFGRGSLEFLHPENREGPRVPAPATRTRRSSSWRTCRASCSTSSSTCPSSRAGCRSRCSGASSSRRSAGRRTSSRSAPLLLLVLARGAGRQGADGGPGRHPDARPRSTRSRIWPPTMPTDCWRQALTRSLPSRRWFRGKARTIKATKVTDAIDVREPGCAATVVTLAVDYTEGEGELYLLPLTTSTAGRRRSESLAETPGHVLAQLRRGRDGTSDRGVLVDAALDPAFMTILLDCDRRAPALQGTAAASCAACPTGRSRRARGGNGDAARRSRSVGAEQQLGRSSATGSSSSCSGRSSTGSTRTSRSGGS